METSNVMRHPTVVQGYIDHGWKLVPIPPMTKGPQHKGWNLRGKELLSASDLPQEWGIGLAHAYSGTCAIDIDNWEKADPMLKEHGIDLQALYDAEDSVVIDSGRYGRGKLLYQTPLGMVLNTKKILYKDETGANQTAYELRCATSNGNTVQDVLPSDAVHPVTCQPYRWAGNGHWSRLPQLPFEIFTHWQSLIEKDQERTIKTDGPLNASWDEIQSALDSINPDCSYQEWINLAMAVHDAGIKSEEEETALQLFNDWSSQGEKYQGEKDILFHWRSFTPGNGITIGTLFKTAMDNGWSKPTPDASELFSAINQVNPPPSPENLIDSLRPPSPDPDLSLWPEVLATRAQEIGNQVGCDPLVPLFAGLGALAGAVDAQIRLELVEGFLVPPTIWLMTVGEPADKKSPGSRPMMDVLKGIEKDDLPRYKQELLLWEAKEAAHNSAYKAYMEWAADPSAQMENDTAPTVPELESKPVPLRITVSDVTSQKLVHTVAERPRGVLCYLDEMNSWVKKLTAKHAGEDRSTWVVGHDSVEYKMDRIGAGSIHCDNFAVSIYGNIQPEVFKNNIHQLADDGLIQRFIPCILRPHMTKLGEPVPEMLTSKAQWEQAIRTAHALPEQIYKLDAEGYKRFREFQVWYEAAKRDERIIQSDKAFMTAFGKLEGTAGRLILLFHLLENPYSPTIGPDVVDRVQKIIQGYIVPAFRYTLGEIGGFTDDSLDVWTTNHIIHLAGEEETVTLSAIKRSARRKLEHLQPWQQEDSVRSSMLMLEQCGWVIKLEDQPTKKHVVWSINPQLATMFQQHREEVIKARQRVFDRVYQSSWKKGKPADRRIVKGYDPDTMDE